MRTSGTDIVVARLRAEIETLLRRVDAAEALAEHRLRQAEQLSADLHDLFARLERAEKAERERADAIGAMNDEREVLAATERQLQETVERAEKAERFNAYLLGETVYAQMQNEGEIGDKIAEEIVDTLMETLIEPWLGLNKEQIERCRVIIPERLPRAILWMGQLNRRLQHEEEEKRNLATERDEARSERDRRPDVSAEDAAALVADYERVTDPVTAAEVRALAALRAHAAKARPACTCSRRLGDYCPTPDPDCAAHAAKVKP